MSYSFSPSQMLYHRGWLRAVDAAKSGLNASLLIRHPDSGELFVNFDPQVMELIQEAKCLQVYCYGYHSFYICKKYLAVKECNFM